MTLEKETGVIVKNYNGYYYVQTKNDIVPCKIRGRFKKDRFSILTGDNVVFTRPKQQGEGSIEEILPRKNRLPKPAVANVDQIMLVFALKNPDFNQNILDRFLVNAEQAGVPVIICFSKCDLVDLHEFAYIFSLYENIGYQIMPISAQTGYGIDAIKKKLKDNTTVFAGLSGVGKSSLLNAIYPGLELATGKVSDKNSRGKHTTRFSQLIEVEQGYIVDTPGYSFAELVELSVPEIEGAFPEFAEYKINCRFSGCTHAAEPDCSVKQAVEESKIDESRYNTYLSLARESKEAEERKFR